MNPYYPIFFSILGAFGVAGLFVGLAALLGPKPKNSAFKGSAFECGSIPLTPVRRRFTVKFYLIALLFVLFDIETVFLFPWAVLYRRLGVFGFVEMTVFVSILTLGLMYVWKKGALEWT